MNDVSVICADSIEWMKAQPAESVHLVIADPPYNLGKEYGNDSDNQSKADFLHFSREWIKEAARLLKPNGTIYVFMGVRHISSIYDMLEDAGLGFVNWVCWHYTQGIGKTRGFSPRHDDVLVFSKGDRFTFNLDEIRVPQKYYRKTNNMKGANPGDVWEFSHVHYCQENRQEHPTQKPEGLIERMVKASSNETDLVLDPFCGSGTTARVCQQLNRKFIGVEINEMYVKMAQERLMEPFSGFDSIDPRMKRVPLDLNDPNVRDKYVTDHIEWFLKNRPKDVSEFMAEVNKIYGTRLAAKKAG